MSQNFDIPKQMFAIVTTGNGGFDKLSHKIVNTPEINKNEVLVKVLAAGINNTEINTRIGWYSSSVQSGTEILHKNIEEGISYKNAGWNGVTNFPLIQGTDCCGIVVKCKKNKFNYLLGKRVIIRSCMRVEGFGSRQKVWMASNFDGAYAEYVKVPASDVFPINCGWSDAELATIPCSYGTSENMLLISNCNQNDTVLITGASGGVGSATIQLAKLRGCNVIAIVSEEKSSYAIQAGADKVIPRNSNLLKVLGENNINLVVDGVGGKNFSDFLKIIAPGGRYVSAGAIGNPIVNFDLRDLYLKDISMFGCTTWEEQVFLNLIKYIEEGRIQPLLSRTFKLSNIIEAQKEFLKKNHFGNFVLIP